MSREEEITLELPHDLVTAERRKVPAVLLELSALAGVHFNV